MPDTERARTDALHDMATAKIADLREEKRQLVEALRCIAYEPFGDPEATDREVLDAITAFARANLPKSGA